MVVSPVILELRSSVSVALDDPHQFHADPRLDIHVLTLFGTVVTKYSNQMLIPPAPAIPTWRGTSPELLDAMEASVHAHNVRICSWLSPRRGAENNPV